MKVPKQLLTNLDRLEQTDTDSNTGNKVADKSTNDNKALTCMRNIIRSQTGYNTVEITKTDQKMGSAPEL